MTDKSNTAQDGICCYGGVKKKADCASCAAWRPAAAPSPGKPMQGLAGKLEYVADRLTNSTIPKTPERLANYAMELRESAAHVRRWASEVEQESLPAAPKGYKLVRDFQVGERVMFRGVEHTIFALGDRKGTFDIHQPHKLGSDRWLNVPPEELADVALPAKHPSICARPGCAKPTAGPVLAFCKDHSAPPVPYA